MRKILIADDSALFRKSIARAISGDDTTVEMAKDGNEALEIYKQFCPDLVLLDVTMPNCDGKECLAKIIDYHPEANVIMISGIESGSTISECLNLGAKGYILKGELSIASKGANGSFISQINSILGFEEAA